MTRQYRSSSLDRPRGFRCRETAEFVGLPVGTVGTNGVVTRQRRCRISGGELAPLVLSSEVTYRTVIWYSGSDIISEMDEPLEIVSVLSDSPHRISILQYVDDDPVSVGEVSSSLDIPRATAKHNLTRLEEASLVESVGSGYTITAFGRSVRTHLTTCLDAIAVSRSLQPFLEVAPASAFEGDPTMFEGSEVTTISPSNPHAPVERLLSIVEEASYLRVVTPVLLPQLIDAFHDGLVERDLHLDLVAPADAFELLRSEHPTAYAEAIESERLIAGVYPDAVPFGLYLLEDAVVLVGHDEENILRCIVENDSTAAVDWASDLFREYEKEVESRVWGPEVERG